MYILQQSIDNEGAYIIFIYIFDNNFIESIDILSSIIKKYYFEQLVTLTMHL